MATNSVVVERLILAAPEAVWHALTDIRGWEGTVSGVERIEVLSSGGFGVGTRWRETRRMLGKETTEELYVTACEPPERYVAEADSHGTHYVSECRLLPAAPERTTVRLTFAAEPAGGVTGVLAKVFGRLGARTARKALAGDLDDIAAAVERRAG